MLMIIVMLVNFPEFIIARNVRRYWLQPGDHPRSFTLNFSCIFLV